MRPARTERSRASRVSGLYAVTPDLRDTATLVRKVTAALTGGAAVVQYRNKAADAPLRMEQARALAGIPALRSGLFIVNDDVELAAAVNADGVHLGEADAAIETARERLGSGRLIGVSCYNDLDSARAAVAVGADYVAFGSFFASPTKPAARRADRALLTRARALGVPVVAIGGITSTNASTLIDAGADAVAVIADVFAHDDVMEVARSAAAIAVLFARRSEHAAGVREREQR
jgi:thiamine-phosphate pyrophosphorylase